MSCEPAFGIDEGSVDYDTPQKLEEKFVKSVYNAINPIIDAGKAWPRIVSWLDTLPKHSLVLDCGCGPTLKYSTSDMQFIGVDISEGFEPTNAPRQQSRSDFLFADNLNLSFRESIFDCVLSVGVLHHFSTEDRRIRAITQITRVLRLGGLLVMTVWAKEQQKRIFQSSDIFVPMQPSLINSRNSRTENDRGRSRSTSNSSNRRRPSSVEPSFWLAENNEVVCFDSVKDDDDDIFGLTRSGRKNGSIAQLDFVQNILRQLPSTSSTSWCPPPPAPHEPTLRKKRSKDHLDRHMATLIRKLSPHEGSVDDRVRETKHQPLYRFYHVFEQHELDQLITQHAPQLRILQSFLDCSNWYVICRKQDITTSSTVVSSSSPKFSQ